MARSNALFIVALCLIIVVAKISGQCNSRCAEFTGYGCCYNDNNYCCPKTHPICCGNQSGCCPSGYRCQGSRCYRLGRSGGDSDVVAAVGKTALVEG